MKYSVMATEAAKPFKDFDQNISDIRTIVTTGDLSDN